MDFDSVTLAHLGSAAFVFLARVADVSLGTFRFALIVGGRRKLAWAIAVIESMIWLLAASRVFKNLSDPLMAVAFALGFATGTYAGMALEGALALGEQVLRVFTREGARVAAALREQGYAVTKIAGEGRDGPVDLLFIQVHRRGCEDVLRAARALDPDCFYVIDDVRAAAGAARRAAVPIRR